MNLLLAEDNLPDALLVKEAIRMQNLPVEIFLMADGERALEFARKAEDDPAAPCPDAILLDLNLPRIDGMQVLEELRASSKYKSTPVIVVTSSNSPEDRKKAAAFGAGYFRKPASYDEFVKIGGYLRQILTENGLL